MSLAAAASALIAFLPGAGASGATTGADLQVSGSVGKINSGESFSYTFQVKNSGPDAATAAVFNDVVPAGITYNYATVNSFLLPCSAADAGSIGTLVTCNLGFLSKGGQATVMVSVKAPVVSGSIANVGVASSAVPDPFLANNSVTTNSQVTVPVCSLPVGDSTSNGLVMLKSTNGAGLFENFQLQVGAVQYTVLTNFYDGSAPLTKVINLDCKTSPVQFVFVDNFVNVTGRIGSAVLPGSTDPTPVIYADVVQVLTHKDKI
jgi:uncharacterized repeat protein (TIGR01451 family)